MSLYFLFKLTYALAMVFGKRKPEFSSDRKVSILLAARDEADNIERCLIGLSKLNYPLEKLEILVGDDGSTDETAEIVRRFIADKPQFRYHYISEQLPGIRGKQNVLAQLARLASGELFFITDADVEVAPDWVRSLAGELRGRVGMTTGPTVLKGKSLFARVQSVDWLMGMGLGKAHANLGIPITGAGNNMAVTREAYESTGGYEKIPFSVAEDYKLFQVMCERGPWEYRGVFHPHALNISEPVESFARLMQQRKRWFYGGRELAWYNKLLLLFNAFVMPILLVSVFFVPLEWLGLMYGAKVTGDFIFLGLCSVFLRRTDLMWWFLPYELYYQAMTILIPLNQILPSKIEWKGRKY